MKKAIRIIFLVSLMAMCLGGAGCGTGSATESKLVGTWYAEESDAIELVFYKDGTYRHGNASEQVNGDYKIVSENEIEFTSNQQGLGADMWHVAGIHEFIFEDDTLTILSGGARGTYYRKK